jgi:hypothetical protein
VLGAAVLVAALAAGILLRDSARSPPTPTPTPAQAAKPQRPARSVSSNAPAPAPSPALRPHAHALVRTSTFTLMPPRGWVRDAREKDHGSYVESRWHPAGTPAAFLLIDHTAGFRGTAVEGARSVRRMTRENADYRELGFARAALSGTDAWRWEFALGDVRKVDWFLTDCGTGYALLGAAPADRWDEFKQSFIDAARSLKPQC